MCMGTRDTLNSRHGRVDKLDMADEIGRDGVSQGADGLCAGLVVLEDGELRIEQLVRLADGDRERQPVAGGGDRLRGDVVLGEPSVDGLNGLWLRCDERFHLQAKLTNEHKHFTKMAVRNNEPLPSSGVARAGRCLVC